MRSLRDFWTWLWTPGRPKVRVTETPLMKARQSDDAIKHIIKESGKVDRALEAQQYADMERRDARRRAYATKFVADLNAEDARKKKERTPEEAGDALAGLIAGISLLEASQSSSGYDPPSDTPLESNQGGFEGFGGGESGGGGASGSWDSPGDSGSSDSGSSDSGSSDSGGSGGD